MSFEAISPNMSLILPGVGQTLSPTWATDLNNSLTIIDQHNHTAGYGVPVPSSGLNINADLSMNSNNLIAIKSSRYAAQSILAGPSDLNCVFVNGVDLYYNDGVGNHVRITQSGGVAGTPGSISNLTSPASASYVAGNQTFVWQSAANTPANMDNASIILRNLVANSFGLTLAPPNAMGADYNLTLPTLPASQKIMTLDASGNMSAPYTIDGVTLEIAANVIQVKNTNIANVNTNSSTSPAQSDYLVDTTSGDISITLQTAVGGSRPIVIKKVSSDGNKVILLTTAGQTIDGAASGVPMISAINDSLVLQSDDANFITTAAYRNPIRASLDLFTPVSIPNAVSTQILFDTSSANGITISSSSAVIKYAGYYNIAANARVQTNGAGLRIVSIQLNGVELASDVVPAVGSGIDNSMSASIESLLLSPGDVITAAVYQNSGGPLNLTTPNLNNNSLSISRTGILGDV